MKFKALLLLICAFVNVNTNFANSQSEDKRHLDQEAQRQQEVFQCYKKDMEYLCEQLKNLHKEGHDSTYTGCLRITHAKNKVIINGRPYRRNPLHGGIQDALKTLFREEGVNCLVAKFNDTGDVVSISVERPTYPHRMRNSFQSFFWPVKKGENPQENRELEEAISFGTEAVQYFSSRDAQVVFMQSYFQCQQGLSDTCTRIQRSHKPSSAKPKKETPAKVKTVVDEKPSQELQDQLDATCPADEKPASAPQTTTEPEKEEEPTEKFFSRNPFDRTLEENKEIGMKRGKEVIEAGKDFISSIFNS